MQSCWARLYRKRDERRDGHNAMQILIRALLALSPKREITRGIQTPDQQSRVIS